MATQAAARIFVAFVELLLLVDDLLFEMGDPLVECIDVGGGAEPGLAHVCSPSAWESRFSSWRMRASSRAARSWAASRSACSEAWVTAGPCARWGLDLLAAHGFSRVGRGAVEEGAVDSAARAIADAAERVAGGGGGSIAACRLADRRIESS